MSAEVPVPGTGTIARLSRAPNQLTEKEKEAVRRYAKGEQVHQIAADLGVHVQNVYSRLDRAKNRTGYESLVGLVHYAIKTGLVEVGDAR